MHLRPSQLLQIQNILEELGLDSDDLSWRNASQHLPNSLPSAVLQGSSLQSQSLGYFFTIGQPWHLYWSPSGEERLSEPVSVGTWNDVVNLFRDWAGQLKREYDEVLLWPESCGPNQTRSFLQRSQMNALYRRFQDRGLPADLGTWSGGEHSSKFQASNYPFFFEMKRKTASPGRGAFGVTYSPGPVVNSATESGLAWAGVLQHFQAWLDAVWEDLPAEQRLRAPKGRPVPQTAWVKTLRLRNVRMFPSLDLELGSSPSSLKLLLGINGAGKSTILRSLALVCSPRTVAQELLNKPSARFLEKEEATIEIDWVSGEGPPKTRTVSIRADKAGNQELFDNDCEEFPGFVGGYGSARGAQGATEPPISRAISLFDYNTALVSPELAVRRLYDHYEEAGFSDKFSAFKRILGLSDDIYLPRPNKGKVELLVGNRRVLLDSWADGFRLTWAWYLDLFDWARESGNIGVDGPSGLLLLDEIEQHLHPKLQRTFLRKLREALPAMQIVATSHSPVVMMGADPEEVVVLQRSPDGMVTVHPAPDFTSASVEEILESPELFDTDPLTPELRELMERQKALLSLQVRSPEEEAELKRLNLELWELVPTESIA